MRQGQQNRRGRGRGRKPQNPLARNYESNGPDVKIRGTASHIAEKYMSLARDALASGDMVTAESYLQHAEHYNRIIMAAQTQGGQQGAQAADQANGGGGRQRQMPDSGDGEGAETETAEAASGGGSQPRQGGGQERGQERGRGRGRPGGNGAQGVHDANGAEPAEAKASDDTENENAPDAVS
jgi:hypothetical protein